MDLRSDDVSDGVVRTLNDVVAGELSRYPLFDLLSREDVRRTVALEADKQALGCTDDAACLAELGSALGAEIIIFGGVGRLGPDLVVSLQLFDTVNVRSIGRAIAQARSAELMPGALRTRLRSTLQPLHDARGGTMPPDEAVVVATGGLDLGPVPVITTVAGSTVLALSGALLGMTLIEHADLQGQIAAVDALERDFAMTQDPALSVKASRVQEDLKPRLDRWNSSGSTVVGVAAAGVVLGAAMGATGAVLWMIASPQPDETRSSTPVEAAR